MKVQARHLLRQSQLQKMARPEAEAQLEVNFSFLDLIHSKLGTDFIVLQTLLQTA